jgi:hypothetical protein
MDESTPARLPGVTDEDRFSLFHFYIWLAFCTLVYFSDQLDRSLQLSYLFIPLLLIPAAIVLVIWLIGFSKSLWNRRWQALAAVVFAPVLTVSLFGTLLRFNIDPDWIHFQLTRSVYLSEVRESPGQPPKHRRWNWGDTGSAPGTTIANTLVFDEADKPLQGEAYVEERDVSTHVRPMGDHFYLITQSW